MQNNYYAHSIPGKPIEKWQRLAEHLINVAKMAGEYARSFGGHIWAELLGQYHDVGKGTLPWQAYLRHANQIADDFAQYYKGSVKHATQGAQILYGISKEAGKLLAYCIAGHHGGLPNWHDSPEVALKSRLEKEFERIEIPMNVPELPRQLPFEIHDQKLFSFQFSFLSVCFFLVLWMQIF